MNQKFSELNLRRCDDPNAFNCQDKSNLYWVTALTEELGEVAGVVKKIQRGFNKRELLKMQNAWAKNQPVKKELQMMMPEIEAQDSMPSDQEFQIEWHKKMKKKLTEELADINTYLDLMASKNEIDLEDATIRKFNKVSIEMGLDEQYIIS